MDISDFIPSYPYRNSNSDFNKTIFELKEFNDLQADDEPEKNGRWDHQELMARYSGPNTAYNEQIMFHTPGTGKTCGSIAVVEDTFKHQIEAGKNPKRALIIVPNDVLLEQWKREITFRCTKGQYIPEHYFSDDPETKLSDDQKSRRINALLKQNYIITTKDAFGNRIRKMKDNQIVKLFDGTTVVIDEAHKLKDKDKKKDYYNDYHRFLHLISGKKLLLTGTPMVDQANEIAGLANLILPIDKQLETGNNFDQKYLTKNSVEINNREKLVKRLKGLISYVTVGGNFPNRIDVGTTDYTDYIKTYNNKMSETQKEGYEKAWDLDMSNKKGFKENSSEAINFVYKHDGKYLWGKEAAKLLLIKSGKSWRLNPKYSKDVIENIKEYSSKLYTLIKLARRYPKDPIFVYNERVSGANGAIFQALVLNAAGIKTRVITGDDKPTHRPILRKFNSIENRDASQIQILIGSKTISTGTNLTTAKRAVMISPWWNSSVIEQSIGRAIRADSLNWLPQKDRNIYVYQFLAESSDPEKNVDIAKFKVTEEKDVHLKTIERFLKEIAWDCALNYFRNYKQGVPDSKDCDFQECNWKCEGIEPNKSTDPWVYEVEEGNIKDDNWLILYSKEEREIVEKSIKNIFKKFSIVSLEKLSYLAETEKNITVLILESFIKENKKLTNKWGIECYIRTDGDLLYLSDNLVNNRLSDVWYTHQPFINEYHCLSNIIDSIIYKTDIKLLECEFKKENIKKMNTKTQSMILENLYLMSLKESTKKEAEEKLKEFSGRFYIFDGIPVHNIEKDEIEVNYVDFAVGKEGNYRCFKKGIWVDCDKKEGNMYSKLISESRKGGNENVVNNQYNVYALITSKGMKIIDKTKETEKSKTDARKKFTGKMCSSWKIYELVPLILRLGIELEEVSIKIPNTETMKNFLISKKIESTDENILKSYKLAKMGNKKLCALLEKFFRENNLFIEE